MSRKVTIEQRVPVEPMCVHWWSDRVLEAIDRAKRKTWPTSAEDQWCDHHMQTVEAAGLKKTRHGIRAAFD